MHLENSCTGMSQYLRPPRWYMNCARQQLHRSLAPAFPEKVNRQRGREVIQKFLVEFGPAALTMSKGMQGAEPPPSRLLMLLA